MTESIHEIGRKLVENSVREAFSARGIVDELFPYLFDASRKMSSRAISRWLSENGVKVSAATVAKTLRESDVYWQRFFELIEPAARTVANAHSLELKELLLREELLEAVKEKPPLVEARSRELVEEALAAYHEAVATLQEKWFTLSDVAREACLANVELAESTEPASKA